MARRIDRETGVSQEPVQRADQKSVAKPAPLTLEQRILLDAAMAETALDTAELADTEQPAQAEDPTAELDSSTNSEGPKLAVVDGSLADAEALASRLAEEGFTVLTLAADQDGVQQITAHLDTTDEAYVQIHVFSHGKDGSVRLGDTVLSASSLARYQDELASWQGSLASGADILLYGCDVASGEGAELLNGLKEHTGADIGASTDLTGPVELGGDWDLEASVGELESYELARLVASQTINETLTTGWTEILLLQNADNAAGDEFGWAVDVADTTGIIAVGGWNMRDVYAFVPTGGGAYDEYKISPGTTSTGGMAVDVDGNFLIVGYRGANRAYIYEFTGSSWVQRASLSGTGSFGYDVGIVATGGAFRAVVGRPDDLSGQGQVSVYYSTNSGTSWTSGGTFTSGDVGSYATQLDFGHAVSIDGNSLVVGAPGWGDYWTWTESCGFLGWETCNRNANAQNVGHAFIYDWSSNGNINTGIDHTLRPDGWNNNTGAANWRFGQSVDVSVGSLGEMVAVGSPNEAGVGEVYVFRDGGNRTNVLPGGRESQFGYAVAIDANTGKLVVGEYNHNVDGLDGDGNDGRVWVFNHSGTNSWGNNTQFDAVLANQRFGWAVAVARDLVIAGSSWADFGDPADQDGLVNVILENDTPVAFDDSTSTTENASVLFNVLANDQDPDNANTYSISVDKGRVLTITVPPSAGTATISGDNILFDPGTDFDYLAVGESTQVTIEYLYLDSGNETDTATLTITINGQNDPVTFGTGLSTIVGNANVLNSYQVPAGAFNDADASDALSYVFVSGGVEYASLVLSSNEGGGPNLTVNISAAGLITYSPNDSHRGYTYSVPILRAKDPNGSYADDSSGFTIRVERQNTAPTAVGSVPDPQNAVEDAPYSFDMTPYFDDVDFLQAAPWDTEELTYSLVGAPNWVSINASTGELQATGPNAGVGSHTFDVQVTDEYGLTATQSVTLVLANTNDAPIITNSVPEQQAFIGASYSYTLPADLFDDIDPTGDTITLSASFADDRAFGTAGPGQWLSFNPGTGQFSGTVSGDEIGTVLSIKVTATDNGTPNLSTDYYFDINVFPLPSDGGFVSGAGSVAQRGYSVAISENGLYMVAGEPAANNYAGAARVYFWNGSSWTEQATLSAAASAAGNRFGFSVDIDQDGNRIVIGSPGEGGDLGRVYAYERAGASWVNATENASYVAASRASGDEFGFDVAIRRDGTRFMVGMPGEDVSAANFDTGAVHMYSWGTAAAISTLLPTADAGDPNGSPWFDRFGASVDYDRTLAIIGAPYDSSNGLFFNGSATIAAVSGSGFTGPAVKISGAQSMDLYGWSVALDVFQGVGMPAATSSVVAAVGAIGDDTSGFDGGAVYTYRADSLTNTPTQGELTGLAANSLGVVTAYDGGEFDQFGLAIAIDGGGNSDVEQTGTGQVGGIRLAVGANVNGSATGNAYVYRYWGNVDEWVGQTYLANSGAYSTTEAGNQFGWSVGIAEQRLVVGAPNADLNGSTPFGALYTADTSSSGIEIQPASFDVTKILGTEQSLSPVAQGEEQEGTRGTLDAEDMTVDGEGTARELVAEAASSALPDGSDQSTSDADQLIALLAGLNGGDAVDGVPAEEVAASDDGGAQSLSGQLDEQGMVSQRAAGDFLGRLAGLANQG